MLLGSEERCCRDGSKGLELLIDVNVGLQSNPGRQRSSELPPKDRRRM
jgi:hypothetical protein